MVVRLTTEAELRAAVSMPAAIAAVRQALLDLADGQFDLPPRIHHADGAYLVMTAYSSRAESTVVKTLSLDSQRTPAIVGTTTWTSTSTPHVVVADAGPVTSMRTGAIVGVATDALAAADASRLVLYGAGGQAADQVRAVHAVRPLTELAIVARTAGRGWRLAGALEAELPGVTITVHRPGDEDLSRADVVCCATPATEPLFRAADLPGDAHVNAIGSYRPSMRELPDELVDAATVLAVDDVAACLAEAGELIRARARGMLPGWLTPLHTLPAGRERPAGQTVFKSVGLAVQDWALMELLARATPDA